jgi:hypothetical protein
MSVQFRHFTRFWQFQATKDRIESTRVNRFIAAAYTGAAQAARVEWM